MKEWSGLLEIDSALNKHLSKNILILSLFLRNIKPTRSEMIEGLTLSNLLWRFTAIHYTYVICIRICIPIYNRRVNKPLSSPFKHYYMLGTSNNYTTTRILFYISDNV